MAPLTRQVSTEESTERHTPARPTKQGTHSGCPCALKARKSPPAAQMPTPGSGLPPEGLWGWCLYFGDTWRPPTAPPSYEPRLWSRRRKAKCKGILRVCRKRRNRLEDGVFGLAPPKRAVPTPCFLLPEAEFVRLIVGISNANCGRPAHYSVLSDAHETE